MPSFHYSQQGTIVINLLFILANILASAGQLCICYFFPLSFQQSSILLCLLLSYLFILVIILSVYLGDFFHIKKKVFSFRKSYCSYTKQGKNTGFGIREIQLHNFLSEFLNFYNCLLSESNRSYCQLDLLLMYCWDSLTFSKIQYS